MRPYIQLTVLQGSLIPEEDSLTPEEKYEREVKRVISGEEEDNHGLTVFTYGNFKEYTTYIPVDLIDTIYGTEGGTVIETEEEAAKAYDEAAKKYHKDFARLNLPNHP